MTKIEDCVLITGGSGFIGLHTVNEYLKAGYKVNTTTRSIANEAATPLHCLAKQFPNQLQIFAADLLEPGAYKEASQGVTAVVHVATPVLLNQSNDQADQQIRPAVEGTRNILQTCSESSTIKTIIVTSSAATIKNYYKSCSYVHTEQDFSPHDNEEAIPYQRAKIFAEREVWKFHQQHPRFRIITIHPCYVLGPDLEPEGFKLKYNKPNAAKQHLENIISGSIQNYNQTLPLVDIRDVALAHVRALQCTDAQGRFIVFESSLSIAELTYQIKSILPKLNFKHPSPPIPNYTKFDYDNQKSRGILGMTYRPILNSLNDTLIQLYRFL